MAKYTITLSRQGGSGTPSPIYYKSSSGRFYYKDANDATVYITDTSQGTTTPLVPTRQCFSFKGFYSQPSGGTQYINSSGNVKPSFFTFAASEEMTDMTLYARWQRVSYKMTLERNNGSGGPSAVFAKDNTDETIYSNSTCTAGHEIASITTPTRAGYTFAGYRARTDGGSTYIGSTGNFGTNAHNWAASDDKTDFTAYANWTPNFWRVNFNRAGGEGGVAVLYAKKGVPPNSIHRYSSLSDNSQIAQGSDGDSVDALDVPTRTGYDFGGYTWTNPTSGNATTYMASNGHVKAAMYNRNFTDDITVDAQWAAHTWTLSFDLHGGEGTAAAKSVTFDSAIGALPSSPTRDGYEFEGWYVDGVLLKTSTKWKWDGDRAAVARWRGALGDVTDYFNLDDGVRLVAISSQSNETWPRVDAATLAKYEAGQIAATPLVNPSVTYAIIGELDIWSVVLPNVVQGLVLGMGYGSGGQGYMVTSISVKTAAGQRPTLTVSATANEGENAISLFPIDFLASANRVSPRSRAQNLRSAITLPGGAHLIELTLEAKCEPVVVMENLVPVASDVVHGVLEASATVIQPTLNSAAPTAGGGWEIVSCNETGRDDAYRTFNIVVRKAL